MVYFSPLSPLALAAIAAAFSSHTQAQDKPTYSVTDLPDTWEEGQVGSNQCGQWKPYSAESKCQNVFVNSVTDFCLWAPFKEGTIGDQEQEMVSYCTKQGYGTRVMPQGTIKGAHFIKSLDFLQVTGFGDFTKVLITAGDQGGELDPHGATGAGNPPGGLVFSRNVQGQEGQWVQLKEWSNFMSADEFSIRVCYGDNAAKYCPHTLDEMGSRFNHPGDYSEGSFTNCLSDSGHFPAYFKGKEFHQGDTPVPTGHKPARTYNCRSYNGINGGMAKVLPYRRSEPMRDDFEDVE
ncbi:hypothetical protein CBS101457_001611 [Exobasidium rhododendri]|nr:hypothetical protein CBS101457_001611 [Exobasidium rhododendri]